MTCRSSSRPLGDPSRSSATSNRCRSRRGILVLRKTSDLGAHQLIFAKMSTTSARRQAVKRWSGRAGNRAMTPSLTLGTLLDSFRPRRRWSGFSLKETMFVDKAFGDASLPRPQCLGVANLVAAIGALRGARRAEVLGEGRFELLRDQHERPPLLREERRMLLDEFERERRERLEAQKRVKQLMREHPHLELERELQRLTEELELEREGRAHNHRERQRLGKELEHVGLARSEDQREARREAERLEQEVQKLRELVESWEELWEEEGGASKASKKG